jgi:hypothetical protein
MVYRPRVDVTPITTETRSASERERLTLSLAPFDVAMFQLPLPQIPRQERDLFDDSDGVVFGGEGWGEGVFSLSPKVLPAMCPQIVVLHGGNTSGERELVFVSPKPLPMGESLLRG